MTTKCICGGWSILFSMTQSNTRRPALVCYFRPPVIAGSLVVGGSLSEDGSKDGWTDDPGVHTGPLGLSTGEAALFCSTSSLYIRAFRFFPDSFLSNKLGLNALVVMLKTAHDVYIYTQIIAIVM